MEALTRSPLLNLLPRARALERVAAGLERRVPGTVGHAHRVAAYAGDLARSAGLPGAEVRRVRRGGVLHDIGKADLPVSLVNKPGPLSEAEFELVKSHAELGAAMVAELDDPDLAGIVRHHHERFDGLGYPDGLAGEEIPLGARIVAVADTFDALTTTRPYRTAIGYREALLILAGEAGTQLDPHLVGLFRSRYSGRWAA